MKQSHIDEAALYWKSGKPLDAGRILYEHISNKHRPLWASGILDLSRKLINPVPEVDTVCEIAKTPLRWKEAYAAFTAVRMLTLRVEQDRVAEPLYKSILVVAENAAKVVYNASGGPAPFDNNAGWRLVRDVHHVVSLVNNSDFASKAWKIVSSEEYCS
jgi:hypothetical protein